MMLVQMLTIFSLVNVGIKSSYVFLPIFELKGTDIFIGMKSNVFLLLFASKYNEKGIRIHLEVNRLRDSIMNF